MAPASQPNSQPHSQAQSQLLGLASIVASQLARDEEGWRRNQLATANERPAHLQLARLLIVVRLVTFEYLVVAAAVIV